MSGAFAIITPSFAPDFERCQLLAESVLRHAAPHVEHCIVVDRNDERLFSRLRSPRTRIVCKEDVLPRWLRRLPVQSKWWLNLKGLPVRGWIIQQITKLSAPEISDADTFLFLDSDAFLVRAYDPRWRRENVLRLRRQIEDGTGRSWIESLLGFHALSEYVIYGVFCEHILGESSGHYLESRPDTLNYWKTEKLGEKELERLRESLRPEHIAIMVSTKSNTPVTAIRRVFGLSPA
jgi:hypothetical protein